MREFSFRFSNLQKGISPSSVQLRNEEGLYDALNVIAGKEGIGVPDSAIHLTPSTSHSFPYPQLVMTSDGAFVVNSDGVFELNLSTYETYLELEIAPGSNQFSCADFGLYQVWANGSTLMYRDQYRNFTEQYADSTPHSVCNFRGQLIMGGMGTEDGKNRVVWSHIGSLIIADMIDKDKWGVSGDMKNTSGNMKMPWFGQVYLVKALRKSIMVYGSEGVSALVPATVPAPGFGLAELGIPGIIGAHAVAGDLDRHWFIDLGGYLWTVSADMKIERLGYNRTFAGLTSIVGMMDPLLKIPYFSTSSICYVLDAGLTRIYERPTSMMRYNGQLIMMHATGGAS